MNIKKTALVCGAGGFIGSHLTKRLKREGFWVRGVDLKFPEFAATEADDFIIGPMCLCTNRSVQGSGLVEEIRGRAEEEAGVVLTVC